MCVCVCVCVCAMYEGYIGSLHHAGLVQNIKFCAYTYTVIVKNSTNFLVCSSRIFLDPPVLVVHPEDKVIIAGSTVMLTCVFGELTINISHMHIA